MFVEPIDGLNNLVSSNFSNRGSVRLRLIENKIIAPIIDPKVEARITPIRVNLVPLTKNPASVKITSEGIGGKIFSTAIKRIMAR